MGVREPQRKDRFGVKVQNTLARAVVKAPKFTHTTPILISLHWKNVNERIQYKIFYLTFKLLYTTQPPYLYDLISLQTPRNTRSSSVVTLARPPTRFLKNYQSFFSLCIALPLESASSLTSSATPSYE